MNQLSYLCNRTIKINKMTRLFLLIIVIFNFVMFLDAQTDTIYRNLTVVQSDSLIQAHPGDTNFVILDVRQAGPYNSGHIQNAINIDYYAPNFSSLISALDHNLIYLVHCQSGARSAATFSMMQTQHFREVYNMLGGMNSWLGAGYPVVTTSGIDESNNDIIIPLVYPDPVSETSYINLADNNIASGKIEIYNITGQKIKESSFSKGVIQINGYELGNGIYFYLITSDSSRIITGNFIVK